MSRKNTLLMPDEPARDPEPHPVDRPQQVPAVKTLGRLFGVITEQSQRATQQVEEIQRQLATGEHVVSIDTNLIDPSPIRDRLDDPNSAEDIQFREEIAAHGQKVPVLPRPHPTNQGRYLTVYGHRRIGALSDAGKPVLAVVNDLTDEEALFLQGLENNQRRGTSFIEKCLYAQRLRSQGFSQGKIAASLSVARQLITKLLGLSDSLPEELIIAIGPAPDFGRPRWEALASLHEKDPSAWQAISSEPDFAQLSSNDRFQRMLDRHIQKPPAADASPTRLSDTDGNYALIRRSPTGGIAITVAKGRSARPDNLTFADWLEQRLASFREDWRAGR